MNTQRVEGHTPTLKPCPHCGLSEFTDIDRKNQPPVLYHPYVKGCPYANRTVSIEDWNHRAPIERLEKVNEALVRALEDCEKDILHYVWNWKSQEKMLSKVRAALSLAKEPT